MFEKNIQKKQENDLGRRSTITPAASKAMTKPGTGMPANPETQSRNSVSGLDKSASVVVGLNQNNQDTSSKLVTDVPKQSVDDLKSIFGKSASTVQTSTPKGKAPVLGAPKQGGDSGWIKNSAPKQEETKVTQQLPSSKSEVPIKQPAPVKENPMKKQFEEERAKKLLEQPSAPGKINSNPFGLSKSMVEIQKQPEKVTSSVPKKEETVITSAPKKETLITSSKKEEVILSSQPKKEEVKQPEPQKKEEIKKEPPKPIITQPEATVAPSSMKAETPKKLAVPSVFAAQPKKEEFPIKKKPTQPEVREKVVNKIKEEQKAAIIEQAAKQIPPPEPKKVDPPKPVAVPPKAPAEQPKPQAAPKKTEVKAPEEVDDEEEEEEETTIKQQPNVAPAKDDVESTLKKKGLWDNSDEDSDEEEETTTKQAPKANIPPPVKALDPPKKVQTQDHRPSAGVQASEQSNDFKNSLASLLAKGNPLAPGAPRRQTTIARKEEEEQKEKIKLDVFKDEEEVGNDKYKNAGVLDNEINMLKPVILKAKSPSKKYNFDDFASDEDDS